MPERSKRIALAGHRFFVELPPAINLALKPIVHLSEADAHHATAVLRLAPGDGITIIDTATQRRFCASFTVDKDKPAALLIDEQAYNTSSSKVHTICLALLKGDGAELAIEKCTELGVGALVIWAAYRSVVKISGDPRKKLERWNKIALSAAKQCNRDAVPTVLYAPNLTAALANLTARPSNVYFCSLSAGAREFTELRPPHAGAHIVIGPEGDLTADEEQFLRTNGGAPISLGPTTLRSETAAIAAVAMANAVWGFEPHQRNP